jgi:circadian clock protein KaiC
LGLPKTSTGIQRLDEITGGGLPAGGPILNCGSAGTGKTILAFELIVRGAAELFEENAAAGRLKMGAFFPGEKND